MNLPARRLGNRLSGWLRAVAWLALMAAAPVASAQITFVGSNTTAGSSATSAISVDAPAGLAADDVMLALIAQRSGNLPLDQNMSSVPAGWVLVRAEDDGNSQGMVVYLKVATASEPASYAWTLGSSGRTAAGIVAFRGVDPAAPVNVSQSQSNAASTTYTAPSVLTTLANTMLVSFYSARRGNLTINAGTGMTGAFSDATGAGSNGISVSGSYVEQPSAGPSGDKLSSGNSSQPNLGMLIALAPAQVLPTPVADWQMDEAAWNGTASEVRDSSGNGYHGKARISNGSTPLPTTASGTPAYGGGSESTCRYGQFDGGSSPVRSFTYVELPNAPAFTSSFTVAGWVRSTNVGASGQRILVHDDADNGWGFSLGDGGSGKLRLFNRRISNSGAVTGNGTNPNCGVFCLDTGAVFGNNAWYFVAAAVDTSARTIALYVYSQAGTLLANPSTSFSGTWQDGSGMLAIGGETAASPEGRQTGFHFKGNIDELQVYAGALPRTLLDIALTRKRTCLGASGPDHYQLSLASSGLSCLPSTVTVQACADASSPCTSVYTGAAGATASLSSSAGTLGATTLTFDASGLASTTLSHPSASDGATVSVTLSGESQAGRNSRQCCANGTSCSAADSCSTIFNTAALLVSGSAGGGAAAIPTQTAGAASGTFYLRAVRTNTTTKACEAALTGSRSVNWAYECNNPATCSSGSRMTITGTAAVAVAGNPNASVSSYTGVPMNFDANGNAAFSFSYADVGQVTLWAGVAVNAAPLSGGTNGFVVKPAGFALSNIRQTASPNLANPAAGGPSGAKFVMAGESFSATLTAVTTGGVATPNFGRETLPEGVLLSPTLAQPAGGVAGTLSGATVGGGSFIAGVANPSNLAYSEVGIVTLAPSIADGNYLGAGDVAGAASTNIGRFYPARFVLSGSSLTHRAALACSPASSFTYLGENFQLGFTLTAQNSAGATTRNYGGSFAKLDPTSASAWNLAGIDGSTVFSPASGRLALGSAGGAWSAGVASNVTLTASALRGSTPDGPFAAAFGIAPVDGDGVQIAPYTLDTDFPANGVDRATVAAVPLAFGRLQLLSGAGAADRPLALPVAAQSWNGSAFADQTADSCTRIPVAAVNFGNLRRAITAADTAVTGAVALSAGRGSLGLSAPGGGRSGTYDVALSLGSVPADASCLQPWTQAAGDAATAGANLSFLRGAWCGAAYDKDPAARASFGLPRTRAGWVYRREDY